MLTIPTNADPAGFFCGPCADIVSTLNKVVLKHIATITAQQLIFAQFSHVIINFIIIIIYTRRILVVHLFPRQLIGG